ncbi:MAG: hypothetical protein HRF49_05415 [bacterium]
MKRLLAVFLMLTLGFALSASLVAQEAAAPPEEAASESAPEGETGAEPEEAATDSEAPAAVAEAPPEPAFDPSSVPLPDDIQFVDLPNDAGETLVFSWDFTGFDFTPTEEELSKGAFRHHYVLVRDGKEILEFGPIAKPKETMAAFPQYWGFDEEKLSKRKRVELSDLEPGTTVSLQIGVVPPETEQMYAKARGDYYNYIGLEESLVLARHDLGVEKAKKNRPDKVAELEQAVEDIKAQIAGLGYTKQQAESAWNEAKAAIYVFPETYQATTKTGWYNPVKTNNLVFGILFGTVVLLFIARARKDKTLFIRRINGLEAVDEAIGRATEMGKPILYLTGMTTLADLATLAAINILGEVSKKIAEYDSGLIVPCRDPVVMTVNQETVKAAYTEAGRPENYNEDSVFFLTEDQFSYTASVNGIMLRDKPAANFFMGYYYAESLLLAETGAMTGAIQIAGTDSLAQLPFFITACDYTLIGEELYAASAYLSREPLLLGSLKGQDIGKLLLMLVILLGTLLASLGVWLSNPAFNFIQHIFTAL